MATAMLLGRDHWPSSKQTFGLHRTIIDRVITGRITTFAGLCTGGQGSAGSPDIKGSWSWRLTKTWYWSRQCTDWPTDDHVLDRPATNSNFTFITLSDGTITPTTHVYVYIQLTYMCIYNITWLYVQQPIQHSIHEFTKVHTSVGKGIL